MAVALVFILAVYAPVQADPLTLITNRSDIGATDSIDWGVLGKPFTTVFYPTNVVSTGGVTIGISNPDMPQGGAFERRDQATLAETDSITGKGGWQGNFSHLDKLLWTTAFGGPITLSFATPIRAGGAQIGAEFSGNFVATIEAFDSMGHSLGVVTENGEAHGSNTDPGDGTAIFIGVLSDQANISSLTFSLVSENPLNPPQDFAINTFSFTASPAETTTPFPEPGSLFLLGVGILGLVGYQWRRHKWAR
jgi:hypothetical protein